MGSPGRKARGKPPNVPVQRSETGVTWVLLGGLGTSWGACAHHCNPALKRGFSMLQLPKTHWLHQRPMHSFWSLIQSSILNTSILKVHTSAVFTDHVNHNERTSAYLETNHLSKINSPYHLFLIPRALCFSLVDIFNIIYIHLIFFSTSSLPWVTSSYVENFPILSSLM